MLTHRSNTVRLVAIIVAFGFLQSRNVATLHAQTDDTWNGGTGNWSDSTFWNNGVPNGANYDVFIDGGKTTVQSVVTLDSSFTVGALTIDAGDTLDFNDNTTLTLTLGSFSGSGSITDNGTININAGNDFTSLAFTGAASIAGSGTLNLNGTGNARVYANNAGDRLTIGAGFTVAGSGNLGIGQSTFTNNGTVNANSSGNILDIQPGGSTADFTNAGAGFAEATSGGTLQLDGNGGGVFSGGTFEALTGSQLNIINGANVSGATLSTAGSGMSAGTVTIINSTLTNVISNGTGSVNVPDNTTTTLVGTFTNNSTFNVNSGNDTTNVVLNGAVTLAGTGTLELNGVNGRIYDSTAGGLLTINSGATIAGAGNLGIGQTTFVNNGTINANQNGNTLDIQPGGGNATFSNGATGVTEATGGGTLQLDGNGGGVFSGGTFEAFAGSLVNIINNADVSGATLATSGSGTVTVNGSTLTNVTNLGTVNVPDNSATTLSGTLTNNGTFNVNSANNTTSVVLSGPVTLAGTGTLDLNGVNGRLYAAVGGDRLTIAAGANIAGAGNLGIGQTTFTNNGTVDANSSGNILDIQPGGSTADFTNAGAGFAEATNGGTLQLDGNGGGVFSGGTFEALTGSQLNVINGANVSSAVLASFGTGSVTVSNSTLTNVTTLGSINVPDNTAATLVGTLTNNGTFNVNSGNDTTSVVLNGAVTLAGTGTLELNGVNGRIYDSTAGGLLTIDSGATIAGAGNLGIGQTTFANNGTVDANQIGSTLVIQPGGGSGVFTNGATGLTEATGGGIAVLTGSGGGTFTNNGVFAVISGSTGGSSSLSVDAGALTNFTGTTLTGGTYNVISSNTANTSTLSLGGSPIVTNAANVTLSGASTVFNEINTIAANQGTFAIANGRNFTTVSALSNSGTVISAGGSTLTVNGSFSQTATGVLTGGGTFAAADFTIAGTVNPGGTVSTTTGLFANAAGTTTLNGNATFSNTTFNYQLGSPTADTNDHLDTNGTLSLSGKLNVMALAGFGTGNYDLIDYSIAENPLFTLDHGTLTLGTVPSGYTYVIDYAIPGQVDLTVAQIAIPEPDTVAFILGGAALLIGLQRVRRGAGSTKA